MILMRITVIYSLCSYLWRRCRRQKSFGKFTGCVFNLDHIPYPASCFPVGSGVLFMSLPASYSIYSNTGGFFISNKIILGKYQEYLLKSFLYFKKNLPPRNLIPKRRLIIRRKRVLRRTSLFTRFIVLFLLLIKTRLTQQKNL